MRKNLTLAEFTALNLTIDNEYHKSSIQFDINKAEEYSKIIPCEIMFVVDNEEGIYYYEYSEIRIIDSLVFILKYDSYRKKFNIHCRSIDTDFKNIDTYTIEREKEKLTKPNLIGVLTAKKVNDWLNYYKELYTALKVINEANSDKVGAFLKSLEGLPVVWHGDKKGTIERGGMLFTFHINATYINTSIEVHYRTGSDLQSFLKLTDNYKP
jgi:hypothetical protein